MRRCRSPLPAPLSKTDCRGKKNNEAPVGVRPPEGDEAAHGPIRLSYHGHAHYNSVEPFDEDADPLVALGTAAAPPPVAASPLTPTLKLDAPASAGTPLPVMELEQHPEHEYSQEY